jgi:hypothetical protein
MWCDKLIRRADGDIGENERLERMKEEDGCCVMVRKWK